MVWIILILFIPIDALDLSFSFIDLEASDPKEGVRSVSDDSFPSSISTDYVGYLGIYNYLLSQVFPPTVNRKTQWDNI